MRKAGKINVKRLKIRKPSVKKNPYNPYGAVNHQQFNHKDKNFYRKTLKQVLLCIVLVLLVILIKNINTPLTNKTEEYIETSLSKSFNAKNTFEKVINYAKETPKMTERVVNVFVNQENTKSQHMNPPVNGEIVSVFGENMDPILNQKTFQRGIDLSISNDQYVKSIDKGEVVEVGQGNSLGKYVKIKHEENIFAIYGNVGKISVKKGEVVEQGQPLAEVYMTSTTNKPFHFELWVNGDVVDPMDYIQFERKAL